MLVKFKDESMGCKTNMYFTRAMETDVSLNGHNRALSLVLEIIPYELAERQKGYIARLFARLFRKSKIAEHPESKFVLFFDSTDFHCLYDLFMQDMEEAVLEHRKMWEQSEVYVEYQKQLNKANEQMMRDTEEHQAGYS